MIQVSLPQLLVFYLAIVLGGLFLIWTYNEIARSIRRRKLRRFQVVCQVCNYHYEDRSEDSLPVCPECGRPNERDPVSEI